MEIGVRHMSALSDTLRLLAMSAFHLRTSDFYALPTLPRCGTLS